MLLPIQFFCMAMTRSGQPVSRSQKSSSSSAYRVILKNHWSSSFWVTSEPHREQAPPSTCSFASTVRHLSHQLTNDFFR